jgi:hypothetical protein
VNNYKHNHILYHGIIAGILSRLPFYIGHLVLPSRTDHKVDFFLLKSTLLTPYLPSRFSEAIGNIYAFVGNVKNSNIHRIYTRSFGLFASPWVFTKLLKVAVTFLRRSGIRIVIYLDDLLIVGTTTEECTMQRRSSRSYSRFGIFGIFNQPLAKICGVNLVWCKTLI